MNAPPVRRDTFGKAAIVKRATVHARSGPVRMFERIEPPDNHIGLVSGNNVTWLTWSRSFRWFLRDIEPDLRTLASPRLIRLRGLRGYNATFSAPPSGLGEEAGRQLVEFARELRSLNPGRRLILFDRLIGEYLDSAGLHAL